MTEVVLLGSLAALMAKPAVLVLRAVVRRRRGLLLPGAREWGFLRRPRRRGRRVRFARCRLAL